MKAKDLLEKHGYNGEEMLMNPETGSIDKSKNWANEILDLSNEMGEEFQGDIEEQFSSLIEIE